MADDAKPTTTPSTVKTPGSGGPGSEVAALQSSNGQTSIADGVVQKIAGIAARQINGVYALGGTTARAFGAIRERIPGGNQNVTQGVTVEVGERQAAVDLGVVVEYGVAISDLAAAIRKNIIDSVERMTGLEVTEVNIMVHDIHIAGDDDDDDNNDDVQPAEPKESRVQ